jgi:NAD(P)-dependent dehydrogenase (short-subunit alcohol dehydrogenase family)|tara:strand:+ start:2300 stop:3130 length:831 start_codon:yes stop_codon:yes gene_type:complete
MSLSSFSLKGKKALVVGARRNMGKGFALGLAEAGADVAVTDVNIESGQLQTVADEIQQMGCKSLALKADISSQEEVKKLVDSVVQEFGTIDILMNVAVMYHSKSVIDLDEESWDKLTDVNLKGYWLMMQEVSPIMMKQKSGSIINLTSRGGLKAHADKMMGNYAIVKSGIAMMTRQYCRYLGPYNVRVNAIAPSLVEWEEFPGQENVKKKEDVLQNAKKEITEEQKFEAWLTGPENLPLGRVATFEEMANAAVFLASDASSYVTGTILNVDGGYMA